MEDGSFLTSFSSWSSYFFGPSSGRIQNESELVPSFQKSIDEFENRLKLDALTELRKSALSFTCQLFSIRRIKENPDKFLQYCYCQKFHKTEFMNLNELEDSELRSKCQNANINGHSALSATMLAPDVSPFVKRDFNQKLVNLDFKATTEDIKTAELILYKSIKESSQHELALIHLLSLHSSASWNHLPYQVKKMIARTLVDAIKKDIWLLPDKKGFKQS